jgi:hypothetical protein
MRRPGASRAAPPRPPRAPRAPVPAPYAYVGSSRARGPTRRATWWTLLSRRCWGTPSTSRKPAPTQTSAASGARRPRRRRRPTASGRAVWEGGSGRGRRLRRGPRRVEGKRKVPGRPSSARPRVSGPPAVCLVASPQAPAPPRPRPLLLRAARRAGAQGSGRRAPRAGRVCRRAGRPGDGGGDLRVVRRRRGVEAGGQHGKNRKGRAAGPAARPGAGRSGRGGGAGAPLLGRHKASRPP